MGGDRPWVASQVLEVCRSHLPERQVRIQVMAHLRRAVPFDAYAWVATDPVSCVGVAPLADVPDLSELPRLIRAKYLTTTNRWTGLPSDRPRTLAEATAGALQESLWWRLVLRGHGVSDVLSAVLRDAHGCWAFVDLWRMGGLFDAEEVAFVSALLEPLTAATRRAVAATFSDLGERTGVPPVPGSPGGAAVVMLADDLTLLAQTAQTQAYLRALLPPGEQSAEAVPASAYNVGAQLLAMEAGVDDHPPTGRVHLASRRWVTLTAARLSSASSIAVTLHAATAAERAGLFCRAHGLTARESELVHLLLTGDDTRHLARRLGVSQYTVQDHLKSVFAKTAAASRAEVVARVLGP